jgi:hypothetical protein
VFTEAWRASEGFLQFHQKRDANGSAMIYGLSVQRDAFAVTCLFIRVDSLHLKTSWQLREGGNLEYALGGCNIPILGVEDHDAFLEEKVLDLIRTLRESPRDSGHASDQTRLPDRAGAPFAKCPTAVSVVISLQISAR